MKWTIKIIGLLVVLFGVFFIYRSSQFPASKNSQETQLLPSATIPSVTSTASLTTLDIPYKDSVIRIFIQKIPRQSKLSLIPNFTDKLNAKTLINNNNCRSGINAGFYTKDQKPLGLFLINGKRYGNPIKSNLVTGFFVEEVSGKRLITEGYQQDDSLYRFAVQAGPLFHLPRTTAPSIIDDEHARRSLIGTDGVHLYMISMHNPDNLFMGPTLSDVPVLLSSNAVQNKIPLRTILNLDGGSASFFYTTGKTGPIELSELTSIGSLLCVL